MDRVEKPEGKPPLRCPPKQRRRRTLLIVSAEYTFGSRK